MRFVMDVIRSIDQRGEAPSRNDVVEGNFNRIQVLEVIDFRINQNNPKSCLVWDDIAYFLNRKSLPGQAWRRGEQSGLSSGPFEVKFIKREFRTKIIGVEKGGIQRFIFLFNKKKIFF